MTASIPSREPATFTAGDTVKWTRAYSDYSPDDGWTVTYSLVNANDRIQIAGTDNGDGSHLFTVTATDSGEYVAGRYTWVSAAAKGAERYTLERGELEILRNLAAAGGGFDTRSHARRMLDALEAVLQGKATKDQQSYSIAGRSLTRLSPNELEDWRDKYRREVKAEENALRRSQGRKVRQNTHIRFNG